VAIVAGGATGSARRVWQASREADKAQEGEALKAQAKWLGERLASIQQRLSEIEE